MLNNWLEGRQLANFRVDEFLGRGGMAQVYRGWDLTLERPVAIKVIAAPFQEDPEYTARFVQEGRSMARWRHENIVHVYYAGQEDGINYIVMEYVEGPDLKTWLARYKEDGRPIPQDEVLRIGKAIANALDYAHEHDIVHRDVKPSNIMMAEDGRILLTDFGLALDLQEGSSGEAFGSPKYIAPEQARSSENVVPQSDLYALGVILYEMLTGSPPFQGGSPTALAVQHLNQAPPLPRTLNEELNEATEKVLLKSLRKTPRNRYQTGQELMTALEAAFNAPDPDPGKANRYSTIPVAEMVSAHLAVPATDEARERPSTPPDPLVPVSRPNNGRKIAVAGIAAVLLLFCGVGIVLISLLANRLGGTEPGATSDGVLFGLTGGSDNGETATQPAQNQGDQAENQEEAPAPTVTLPGEGPGDNSLIFFYNAGGFYAWNAGSRDITVSALVFEALDGNGNPTGAFFEGRRWAGYFPRIQVGKCDRLEILNDVPKERPAQCGEYNAIMTPEETDPAVFWLPLENVAQFRVTYDGQEIGRCNVGDGQCQVNIP